MGRNYLAGRAGDAANAMLAAVGYNFRRLLAWLAAFLRALWLLIAGSARMPSAAPAWLPLGSRQIGLPPAQLFGEAFPVALEPGTSRATKYGAKYDKAVACLTKDRDALLTFYDFPAEHWDHLRTSNPVESVFATVRHRTVRAKGAMSQDTARLMVFKLIMAAAKTWRRLKGENQLPKVIQGIKFTDGVEVISTSTQSAA